MLVVPVSLSWFFVSLFLGGVILFVMFIRNAINDMNAPRRMAKQEREWQRLKHPQPAWWRSWTFF